MKFLDWVLRRKPGPMELEAEGRLGDSWRNHQRLEADLPPQKRAWLIDRDGTKHYHDLDIQHSGEPHGEVRTKTIDAKNESGKERQYFFDHEEGDYLIYYEY